ncbi:MAG: hypothetical protein WDA75_21425, partial [Candidatus Latescibacterota bacterium]
AGALQAAAAAAERLLKEPEPRPADLERTLETVDLALDEVLSGISGLTVPQVEKSLDSMAPPSPPASPALAPAALPVDLERLTPALDELQQALDQQDPVAAAESLARLRPLLIHTPVAGLVGILEQHLNRFAFSPAAEALSTLIAALPLPTPAHPTPAEDA